MHNVKEYNNEFLESDIMNNKLSESAKNAMEDIINEYRDFIIGEALELQRKDFPITANDVYEAKSRVDRNTSEWYVRNRIDKRKRMSMYLLFMGVIYGVIGFFIFVIRRKGIHMDEWDLISLSVGLMGLLMSLFAYVGYISYNQKKSYIDRNKYSATYDYDERCFVIVKLWRQIEQLGRQLMYLNGDNEDANVSSVIDFLLNSDSDNALKIKEILAFRNSIVHTPEVKYSKAKIEEIIAMEHSIIEELDTLYATKQKQK